MTRNSFRSFLLLLTLSWTAAPAAADHVWIEAETLATPPAGFKVGGWGNRHYLSGDNWLFASIEGKDAEKVPAEGLTLSYPFEIRSGGKQEVWARVGYESIRAPLRWRIDGGPWGHDGPDKLTTDLMSLQDWNEVAWVQLGVADLAAGKHTLEIHFDRRVLPGKKQPERIVTGLDCFCISREPFRPNGKHRPDENWQTPEDRKAAAHVFQGPSGPGVRAVLPLRGDWVMARWDEQEIQDRAQPVKQLPANFEQLFWQAAKVPGNRDDVRPDLLYCHRFLYRTGVHVPASQKGHSFVLRFPNTVLLASVFVNGQYCGGSTAPCAAWDADITRAIVPGNDNEIVVAIKDLYYAIEKTGDGKSIRALFNYPASWFYTGGGGGGATRNADFPVLLQVAGAGILETPTLTITGPAYSADVFAMPSVARKELGLEITLHNSSAQPVEVEVHNEIVPLQGGAAEKTFTPSTDRLPPDKDKTIRLTESWDKPRLWWPDDPQMYQVVTRLLIGGKVVDERRTKFGFRQWQWSGQAFRLNGVPWHFHADTTFGGRIAGPDREKVVQYWKKSGINTVRYWGQRPWVGDSQQETLDFFDTLGMPIRRTGIFDGEGGSYNLVEEKGGKHVARKALFDNWIHQLRAQIKAERNHPCIFVWSIENEITFINIRNFGLHDQCEPEIRRAVKAAMAIDPTRPAMIDGGDALRDRSLPLYGNHYNEANFREYPDEAYTMKLAFSRYKDPWTPWPLGDDRPLFIGESFFANGHPPAAYAAIMGEQAFLGRSASEKGVHKFARILAEGYRWHGIAGFHFWFDGTSPDNEHYRAFQPVAVFCREWNWTFDAGQVVERRLKVFNDTRKGGPIDVAWSFRIDGKAFGEGAQSFSLAPGAAEEFDISFRTPPMKSRTHGELVLTCDRGGQTVFRDVKPLVILPPLAPPPPDKVEDITVYDPKGIVQPWLKERGYPYGEAPALDKLPAKLKVLIVGPDALTAREATDPRWLALAASGTRVLLLDQTHPLHYQAVPADLTPTDHVGRIAFPENLEHPAFAGLGTEDFFCWSGDHVVYRNVYKKASHGARSLLQCDDELSCSALCECPVKDGVLILAQTALGSKLKGAPVARRLLDNLVRYCLNYQLPAKTTVSVFPAGDLRLKLLDRIGLKHQPATDLLAALADPKAEILVADASPANLARLAGAAGPLERFTRRGGYLMLWGLTPDGLADYNRVVGMAHVLRPFRMERVTLPGQGDPLLAGITARDVVLEGTEAIYPWAGDRYPGKDTFTYVVDLDDIAPFAKPDLKYAYGWSQMTNGLTSADSWKFIFYHELKNDPLPKWSAEFPHPEEVLGFSIILNTHYQVISKLRLVFDDRKSEAVTLDLKGIPELKQEFPVPPRLCRKITLEPVAFDGRGKQPTTGVDNIWIKVRRDATYQQRVVPLLNIGALVKYRLGKGGVLLNQLRILESEPNPVNGPKKQTIVATLLRNLGATFAAEKLLVPGANLAYQPVPLNDKCNQFLTSDRGWLPGQPDLGQLPRGEQKFAGVDYAVRDFKTSPLPACIMLAGGGMKGLPSAVKDIPVGKTADVLFFLHALHRTRDWRPRREDKNPPPAVFQYVIHYADGKIITVPVRFDRGVGHWLSPQPQGFAEAAVAWTAPAPRDPRQHLVVYQMPWANPRPEVAIASIDVTTAEDYGVPIVLAITAARVRE